MHLRALSSYGARGKFEEYERKRLYVVMHLRFTNYGDFVVLFV